MIKWSYCAILVFFCSACDTTKDPEPSLTGSDYFPLEVGRFIEYEVTETVYTLNSPVEVNLYQLRQVVVDSIRNQAGSYSYILYRYRRDNDGENWEFLSTWTARQDINRIVVQEGNIPFIKLSLPVRPGLMWDGNALNARSEDTYLMASVNKQDTIIQDNAVSVVQVIQEEFDDIIIGERDIRRELYAKNIGLIEREIIQLDLCPIDNCPNQEIIERGIEYKETIRNYGTLD